MKAAVWMPGRVSQWWQDNRLLWLRLGIVVGVVLASLYLGPRASQRHLLLLIGAAVIGVFWRWPQFGPVAVVGASFTVPFALKTGTQSDVNVTVLLLLLLLALWMVDMARRREMRLVRSGPVLPLLTLGGVATLSFLVGNSPQTLFARTAPLATQLGGLGIFLLSIGAVLLVGHQIRDVRWLQGMTWLFLGLGAVYLIGRVIPGSMVRLFAPGSDGSVFWVWMVALAASQALFNRRLADGWRIALLALAASTLAIGWIQGQSWISGWLPPLVVVVALLWLRAWPLGLVVTAIGAVYIWFEHPGLVAALFSEETYSIVTRDIARQILLRQVLPINPILGLGPANYYWYVLLFPILGYYVNFNSHNNYVDILLQTGILGMACFGWVVLAMVRLGWRLRHVVPPGFEQAYVYGALAGIGGMLVAAWLGDWVLPFVYNIGLTGFRTSALGWMFLGGLIALERLGPMESGALGRAKVE